ncbi:hypothetical protein [Rhizobium sp. WYJ-E13]|uniref:hypothetical protein n=1 Tax=Rhizobium sp. WYJ-E13 TaxID=2849093 RepID=UPI001C1EA78C|nr:hypothetical protein [Rhizobium sp. WYJ-E13]QWW70949.1 hypothetical protein KQ933_29580 [Rhizobium sp. WYJ-E13]
MLARSTMALNRPAIRTGATTRDVTKLTPSLYGGFHTTGDEGGAHGTVVKGDLIMRREIKAVPSEDRNCGAEFELVRDIPSNRSSIGDIILPVVVEEDVEAMRGVVTGYTDRLQVSSADMLHGRQS